MSEEAYSSSEEEMGTAAPWLVERWVDQEVSTVFPPPKSPAESQSVDFQQSVKNLSQVAQVGKNIESHVTTRADVSEVRKKCNFVFLPGVLFNRPIGRRLKV